MGIYFIAAGNYTRNREKSLDHGFSLVLLRPYVTDQVYTTLCEHFRDDDTIYAWGANEGSTLNQLRKVQSGEYVVDVQNTEVKHIFTYCFRTEARDARLQEFIGWDRERPRHQRRLFQHVFFLKDRRQTLRSEKTFFGSAFAVQNNPQWLVKQRYFDDVEVARALRRKNITSLDDFLGLSNTASLAQQPIRSAESTHLLNQTGTTKIEAPKDAFQYPPWLHDIVRRINVLRSERIHAERNHEDLVASLFEALGYLRTADIRFQQGYIDILILSEKRPLITVEVKADWSLSSKNQDYVSQAYNYANKQGTRYVVLTNGDRYVLFDRDKGRSYEENYLGEFQLTRLSEDGLRLLESIQKNKILP